MKRLIGPLILGIVGVAVLLWLGQWQVQRLNWKHDVLAQIDTQISAQPMALPDRVSQEDHQFLPIIAAGRFVGPEIHILASNKDTGAGYRVIVALETGGRRVLVDRGFIPIPAKNLPRPVRTVTVVGNLHWPDEMDKYTPEPDIGANIWFARDVAALAQALGTDPVLIVASQDTGDGVSVFPVNSASIPNNHLNYAITWFLLAAVWFGMTVYLLWRIKRQSKG